VIESLKKPTMVPPRRIFDVGGNPYRKSRIEGLTVVQAMWGPSIFGTVKMIKKHISTS